MQVRSGGGAAVLGGGLRTSPRSLYALASVHCGRVQLHRFAASTARSDYIECGKCYTVDCPYAHGKRDLREREAQ